MFGFEFGIKEVIDILLVALLLYEIYRLLKRSGASSLFWGILAFVFVWILVSYVFQLELTGAIFDRIVSVGAIGLIIIFQEEIRSFFYRLGNKFAQWRKTSSFISDTDRKTAINEIVLACTHMSKTKTGALIVLSGNHHYAEYTESGEIMDARISARTIENIFFKNTPLHDGALFICKGRLYSAACILPVTKRQDLPQSFGLRHRAALGLTEKTDTTCIVVSEETGRISIAHGNDIRTVSEDGLLEYLSASTIV